jgi:hypothetical protein
MRNRAAWIPIILLAIAFAAGILRLFELRFERGDMYPPYSTLRTDPLGCRVLYDSLDELPGIDVSRHHDELDQIQFQPPPALVFAGSDTFGWDLRWRKNSDAMHNALAAGGRVVVALLPQGATWFTNNTSRLNYDDDDDDEIPFNPFSKNSETNKPSSHSKTNSLTSTNRTLRAFTSWGFEVAADYSDRLDKLDPVAQRTTNAPAWLPAEIPCHTHAYFKSNTAWRVCYEREGKPVVIERDMSGGSMIVIADAYVLSNEAMLKDRRPDFMSWLIGDRTRIVFDESHHGIAYDNGFGDLARKYGLQGFLIGLLLLVALYVWMSSVPLLPRETDANIAAETRIAGRDSAAGLINLLRRNIPEKTLLAECLTAWESAKPEAISPERRAEIQRITATEKNPVTAYRAITAAMRKTSKDWKK